MSKIATYEKFFIGRIAEGLEELGAEITQADIELLLSERLEGEDKFSQKIKKALTKIYSSDDTSAWDEYVIKLYKGRETLLRDLVIGWYSSYKKPGFFERLKALFKR